MGLVAFGRYYLKGARPPAEAEARATRQGRIFERMWDYLSYGDPELPQPNQGTTK